MNHMKSMNKSPIVTIILLTWGTSSDYSVLVEFCNAPNIQWVILKKASASTSQKVYDLHWNTVKKIHHSCGRHLLYLMKNDWITSLYHLCQSHDSMDARITLILQNQCSDKSDGDPHQTAAWNKRGGMIKRVLHRWSSQH